MELLAMYLFKMMLFFKFDANERLGFYKMFSSFIDGGVNVKDAIEDLLVETCKIKGLQTPNEKLGGRYEDPLALSINDLFQYPILVLFLQRVLYRMERLSTPVASAMKGMIPQSEEQVLIAANKGGVEILSRGLKEAIAISHLQSEVSAKLRAAFIKVGVLIVVAFSVVIFFGYSLVPEIKSSTKGMTLPDLTVGYFVFVDKTLLIFPLLIVALALSAAGLSYYLPRGSQALRLVTLDKYSIFSIYRIWTSASILSSLASLQTANVRFVEAIGVIKDHGSPYLQARMQMVFDMTSRGVDEGGALVKSGLFDDVIAIQVLIFSKNNSFADNVASVAKDCVDDAVEKILGLVKWLNLIVTILIAGFVVYSYAALMALSDIKL